MSIRYLPVLAMMLAIGMTAPAYAEKGGNGHGKGHEMKHNGHDNPHGDKVIITSSNRDVIRGYLGERYGKGCPPGLAKKNNGCLPPGQAKKQYEIGQPLEARWQRIPRSLLTRLEPAPRGYRYVMVDRDVVLMSERDKMVIDAISLFSALR